MCCSLQYIVVRMGHNSQQSSMGAQATKLFSTSATATTRCVWCAAVQRIYQVGYMRKQAFLVRSDRSTKHTVSFTDADANQRWVHITLLVQGNQARSMEQYAQERCREQLPTGVQRAQEATGCRCPSSCCSDALLLCGCFAALQLCKSLSQPCNRVVKFQDRR